MTERELTPEDFIQAGYKKFKDSFKTYAEFGLQKKVTDVEGVLYFITLYAYNFEAFPQANKKWSFETDVQFRPEEGSVNIRLQVEDIQVAEARIRKMWEFFGKQYYEKYTQ